MHVWEHCQKLYIESGMHFNTQLINNKIHFDVAMYDQANLIHWITASLGEEAFRWPFDGLWIYLLIDFREQICYSSMKMVNFGLWR